MFGKNRRYKISLRQSGIVNVILAQLLICVKCGVAIAGSINPVGATMTNLASALSALQTPGVPLNAKQRKERIHFWTMLCTVTLVICTLMSIASWGMAVRNGLVAEELLEKSAQRIEQRLSGRVVGHQVVGYVINGTRINDLGDARLVAHALVNERTGSLVNWLHWLLVFVGIPYLYY